MKTNDVFYRRLQNCLGQIVASRRKRLGMTQEELAQSAEVDRAFVSGIERNKRNPSFSTMARIAYGLRMKYARLVDNCEHCAESAEG